jgi:hypothetical protein
VRRFSGIAIVMVALVAAVGCDDGAGSSACSLLTDAEAETVLGVPTRPGVEEEEEIDLPETVCSWVSKDSTTDPHAPVYGITLFESDAADERTDFDETRTEDASSFVVEPVPDLGDEAYYVVYTEPNSLSGTPSLPRLNVRVGDVILHLGILDSDERPVTIDEAKVLERDAAELVLNRLNQTG